MKFSIFDSAKAQQGRECTYEEYLTFADGDRVRRLCAAISHEEDYNKRANLKKQLPVITWQAFFEGRRLNAEAQPSGLFMLDIDHVEHPTKLYNEKMCGDGWKEQHGIVFVGITASGKGLRLIAKCRPEFHSIDECQQWLSKELEVEHDPSCKDMARCSYLVSSELTLFIDTKGIWKDEPEEGTLYATGKNPIQTNAEFENALPAKKVLAEVAVGKEEVAVDQREGLFGGPTEYKGIPLDRIAKEWLEQTGGIPEVGERHIRLYKLALRMRYICDFNEATMLKYIPNLGKPEDEMKALIHDAVTRQRASDIPVDLKMVVDNLLKRHALTEGDEEIPEVITSTAKLPPMPPVIKQFVENAPDDFKQAVLLCQLPILGALGSKLRARYLDGELHSPSFQVSLEAPQASGKSFMRKLCEYELKSMIEHDDEERQKEAEYDKKIKEMKLLNIKVTAENKDEILGSRPETLIRYVPATMSITKLLMRMSSARGLHLFAIAEEIDTVTKTFKRGFSSYSDLLRVAFDNGRYGQDYASENSFSGNVHIFYNMLTSGTPKAMRRFYPDVEDGLVSRVCFVTLPDQFGKRMPVWKELTEEQKVLVDRGLIDLNDISLVGDQVQEDHVMKMDWLNAEMQNWLLAQQAEAVKDDDRTRDVFCRRAAVIGFRAGMLAFFLYHEKRTPTIVKNVKKFAVYVANCCLNQHLLRFQINNANSNTNQYEDAYKELGNEFTRQELKDVLRKLNIDSPDRTVLYKWKLNNLIEETEKMVGPDGGRPHGAKFKKINNN